MDFWLTAKVLIRRWYVAVPAFFVTLAAAATVYATVPLQYQSTSILVLTTPLSGGTETTNPAIPNALTNPMMNFDRSLSLSASVVIQHMSSSEAAAALGVTPEGSTDYEVTNGTTNPELLESGPFVFVRGTGPSPAEAQEVTQAATDAATAFLERRQNDLSAPESTHINVQTVVAPTVGQPLTGSPLRAAAAAGALAALMSLVVVFGFESLTTHRGRRRELQERRAPDDPPPVRCPDEAILIGAVGGPNGRAPQLVDLRRVNGTARDAEPRSR